VRTSTTRKGARVWPCGTSPHAAMRALPAYTLVDRSVRLLEHYDRTGEFVAL